MSVRVVCSCGTSYELKDEFAGRLVKCPQCGRENRVPAAAVAARTQADPVFDRDLFLLRQQLMRISETYDVGDEKGVNILFVVRPAHLAQNLGALLVGAVVFFGGIFGSTALADRFPPGSAVGALIAIFGLLRTNFLILRGSSDDIVGEFKRKFTILDRYVLDMSADPQRLVDRRIALALGLMLDTGERR